MAGGRLPSRVVVVVVVAAIFLAFCAGGAQSRVIGARMFAGGRGLKELVPDQPLVLEYHGGAVLPAINVYILWYGQFTPAQKAIVTDFFGSIQGSAPGGEVQSPSVQSWWKLTAGYKDASGASVPAGVKLAGEAVDSGSLGKNLKDADMERLVQQALAGKLLPVNAHGLYLLLTADDVLLESFCRNSCGTHSVLTGANKLPYAWVGNSAHQCPGMCAWPFAPLGFPGAPATAAAKPPNGDVGVDGMIISIATVLAGASTNPFGDAFYQGDARAPLEAASACAGNYGPNSYPGYPGDLISGSFNVYGLKRNFLVPALVNPATSACAISG